MKIHSVAIENSRGIRSANLVLPDHAVLIGDNNAGKSSVLEAIDLVLGPDRLNRRPPVDEHDFYQGKYLAETPHLRSLRTGSRALSLEHGSLLDIILRLKEIRPQMWEGTIKTLAGFNVASDPDFGISGVLESINRSLKKYVPREWGVSHISRFRA
jgi:hypothetical protein